MYSNSRVEILEAFKDISMNQLNTKISNAGFHLHPQHSMLGKPMELPFDVVLVPFNNNMT
jgi:hypothetical protein